jgi:hypothetical protein
MQTFDEKLAQDVILHPPPQTRKAGKNPAFAMASIWRRYRQTSMISFSFWVISSVICFSYLCRRSSASFLQLASESDNITFCVYNANPLKYEGLRQTALLPTPHV